jgi:hypothetical protein
MANFLKLLADGTLPTMIGSVGIGGLLWGCTLHGRFLTSFALDKDLAPNARGYSTWILNTYFFILGMVFKLVFTTKVRAPLA